MNFKIFLIYSLIVGVEFFVSFCTFSASICEFSDDSSIISATKKKKEKVKYSLFISFENQFIPGQEVAVLNSISGLKSKSFKPPLKSSSNFKSHSKFSTTMEFLVIVD